MDSRFRNLERRAASGSPTDEAALLTERLRADQISRRQLLVISAAGISRAACLTLGLNAEQAADECAAFLPPPNSNLFLSIVEQIGVVWELNQLLGWGLTVEDFLMLLVPTQRLTGTFATWILVKYEPTVQSTFDGLWQAIQSRHANTYRSEQLKSDENHLCLLDGIVHPGRCLRWEAIDLGANWDQENGIAPRDVRDPANSPHAGILAAAALHTKWVEAMGEVNGQRTVPYVWLPGYQFGGKPRWSRVPWLHFDRSARQVRLHEYGDDYRSRSPAVPVLVGSPLSMPAL